MTVYLCIPHAPVPLPDGRVVARKGVTYLKLRWTAHHPMSSHGIGVILDAKGGVFDGHNLRRLRDTLGAWLEAEDMERVRGALGLAPGERVGQ